MAVEIPVIVDIDQAFQDAAKRVSAAMAPLQRELSGNALDFKIGTVEIDENKVDVTLRKIKEEGAETFGGLSQLISVVNRRLSQLAAEGDKINFTSALEVKHYLEDMATSSKTAQLHIDGLANSLQGIRANINAARVTLETAPIKSDEWNNAAISLEKYKKELKDTEDAIRMVSADQARVDFLPYIDKAAEKVSLLEDSVKRLSAEMKGFMTRKEMTFFPADPETIEKARKGYERVTSALLEAQSALNRMSGFQQHIQELSTVNIQLLQMRDHYERLEEESKRMATSIEGYQIRLNEINQQWRQMTAEEKFTSNGQLTSEARALYESFKKQTEEMEKQAAELSQIYQKEQRRTQLAERGAQKRRYENAILNTTVKTIRVLQEQERILSDRLNRSVIGSSKYEQLKKQLEDVRAELNKINGKSIKEVGDEATRTDSKLASLIKNSARLFALHTGGRFVKNIREVTAEFELQKVALGSIIQDTSRAESLFREIKAAAIESPFEIKDLVTYTKQLSAYQIETDKLFSTTMRLADVSAGLGVDMGRLILAFGQVRAASVLRGQELRQFTEAGIPLVDKLAEKFTELNNRTVTTAEVFDLISKRAVPFSMIEEIFRDMTDAGGMFYKMQEKQAETLAGQWANLKDSVSIMYDEIGRTDAVHGAMTTLIKDAKWLFQNWRSWAQIIKVAGTALLSYVAVSKSVAAWNALVAKAEAMAAAAEGQREKNIKGLISSLIGKTAAEKISTLSTKLYTAATNKAAAANTVLGKTFWNLMAAMAANPFGILAITLGAAIAGLVSLKNKVYDVEKAVSEADASIKSLRKNREETSKLIDSYEDLANKSNLAEKEQRKLKDISRELAKEFPKATEGIDRNTGALVLNIEKLREYSQASRDVIESGMRAEIEENEKAIKKNEKRIERIQKTSKRGWGFGPGGFYYSVNNKDAKKLSNTLVTLTDQTQVLKDKNDELRDALNGVFKTAEDRPTITEPWSGGGGDRLAGLKKDIEDILKKDIEDITNAYKKYKELLQYESVAQSQADIGVLFPSLKGWEPSYENMVSKMEKMLSQYSGDADATRIIEQALANIKFDKIKSDLSDSLKKLSEDIKRSETARDFFSDILGLTGDNNLATSLTMSIYGGKGEDFAGRMQTQLNEALKHIKVGSVSEELRKAFLNQDFKTILANLDQFPVEWQEKLKEMAASSEKFQADRAKELVKALERAKTYGEQRVEIAKKTAQRTAQIQAMDISDNAKKQLLKQNAKKEAEDSAKLAYEAFKDTPMYIELFADLDTASGRMLRNMRENLEGMKQNWKDLHPRELKELQSRLNELDEQIARRNPFKALVESIKQYRELQKQQTRAEADQAAIDADARLKSEEALYEMFKREYYEAVDLFGIENGITKAKQEEMEAQAKVIDAAKKEAEEAQDTANSYRNAAKHIEDAAEKMQDWAGYVSDSLDGIGQIVSTFASDDVSETFDIIAEGIGKTIGGAAQLGKGIAELIMLNPQGIVDTIQGLGGMISGIFGTKSQLSIKAINKKIDEQDRLLSQLTYSYGRLEAAMAKAFGSDYIYNYTEQLKNLQAQQAAYEEQARLERSKAKNEKQYEKRYKETTEEFLQSAKEVEDQILEMRGKLAEFFAGSDLTSAAEDFANAWIDAYMEFGSTTDAISEKFKDMVNNMIVKSLAGAAMQNLLKPVFDEIDSLAIDGELTAAEIGRISAMATAAIPQINDAMTGLMNNLTTAGIDLRTHAGQFTGISRDFAGASEESILGLAAAVNTANFYISHVPAIAENVAALRAALAGDTPANVRTTASEGPSYEDQMLGLVGRMPTIEQHLSDLLSEVRKVIKSTGSSFYVAIR